MKEISEKNLARIIQARMEEIFDFVSWEISRSGFQNKLLAGLVLTVEVHCSEILICYLNCILV
ncbi:MAG: hypothetical protein R2771_09040 [Saprospiraceae bacterium]